MIIKLSILKLDMRILKCTHIILIKRKSAFNAKTKFFRAGSVTDQFKVVSREAAQHGDGMHGHCSPEECQVSE